MKDIDKYNAPRGFIAVVPDEFSHDGIGECAGCCFDSGDDRGCVLDMQHDDFARDRGADRQATQARA